MTAGQEYAEIEVMKMVTCLYSTASGMYVYVCVMHLLLYVCMYIIYLCMYVCMYIFMYVCMYVYMYVCMYIFMYVCMYVCMYIFMYVCMYVYMYVYIYVCTYVYMYVCMYACMYVCMYIFMYVCMYLCMYVCMYVYIYVCMYVFMYVFMHVCMYKYNYICVNNYRLHYTRQPGAILHPGTQVARLELDDPSSIKQANKFCGTLPTMSSDQNTHGTKINQVFEDVSKTLHYIMCGYTIPDDQLFTEKLRNSVTLFLKSLKDPSLPLLELKV